MCSPVVNGSQRPLKVGINKGQLNTSHNYILPFDSY